VNFRQAETSQVVKFLEMTTFGERLKQAFNNASNAEIARKLGVSEPAVKNYVGGRVPDADKLLSIRNLTKCNLDWLLTGEEPSPGPPHHDELTVEEVLAHKIHEIVKEELRQKEFDALLTEKIRLLIKEELRSVSLAVQDLGTVDEFDLAAAIDKYDNPETVLREWYTHDHIDMPEFGTIAFAQGWENMSLEEKTKELKGLRRVRDRQAERRSHVPPKNVKLS
jgi:transcriptional regulator with XRE-family HTH domain